MVPIWVTEPIGRDDPRRTFSTPAMNVVATAPNPTHSTPSFPSAGAIFRAISATATSFRERVQRGVLEQPHLLGMLDGLGMHSLFGPQRFVHPAGVPVHVHEPLHHRDDRREG